MTRRYLVTYSPVHPSFRIPEIISISQSYGFQDTWSIPYPRIANEDDAETVTARTGLTYEDDIQKHGSVDTSRPFMVITLEKEEHAKVLAERCILIKSIHELWAIGPTYAEIHEQVKSSEMQSLWKPHQERSFKFIVTAANHTIPFKRQADVMKGFDYMKFLNINVKNPEVTLNVYEEYVYDYEKTKKRKTEGDGEFIQVYFGRLIAEGTARKLITAFDVKKRAYYGNTSMEAEMSLLMANQAKAAPGKFVYDPFAGTGSMLYTSAHFGAMVFGSDIDGRQMRGKDETSLGVLRSAAQYGVQQRVVGCCTFDVTHHPFRRGGLFDAIVTDPPYGVRAGAKRLGSGRVGKELRTEPQVLEDGVLAHLKPTYRPPTRPYEISDLAKDLIELGRWLLRPGGRVVYFLPTVSDEYQEVDIPTCEGMRLVGNSLQDFGKWGRRLITMEKVGDVEVELQPRFEDRAWQKRVRETTMKKEEDNSRDDMIDEHVPAHRDFRVKYFQSFRKEGE
ncbi:hypothetical protein FRC03_003512 [Tulasnella sp. 419]|nr:hypothetical protein FRC03_003512 [Tulasnella sp. 419]